MKQRLDHAFSEIRDNYSSFNWWRNRVFVPYVIGSLTRLNPSYPGYKEAIHVMEEDWDNLIVLDACRADAFERVADLDRFDDYRAVASLGSHSSEWTRRNFAGGQFGDTVYISANPHTSMLSGDSFHSLIEMWDQKVDEDTGVVLPDVMVEATLDTLEEYPNKRLISHFMQPHAPFVGSEYNLDDVAPPSKFWKAYDENLEYVLEYIHKLLENLPGRTIITSDHGTMRPTRIGKILGLQWHKPRLRNREVSMVPWATVENGQRKIIAGTTEDQSTTQNIDKRLRDLGYKV